MRNIMLYSVGHAMGAAINDLKESLTSLLNDENSVGSCLIFKFLTKLTTHISLRKYAVELPNIGKPLNIRILPNIREYQTSH